jgi:ATP-binding cassette, subfamily B (MDR/TAP), member 1
MHCPQAEKKEDMVPVLDLFYFADWLDWILIFFGSLAGIVTGVAMPAFMYIFGQILDEIGRGKGSLEETVNKLALAMTLIGVVSFVCSTLQVALFSLASARQTERLRFTLLHAILRQEVGWFDTNSGSELPAVLSE